MENRIGDWIQVYTGGLIYPLDPHPEEIFVEDIAHALANQCRYSGHCESFYSVAQHSFLVSVAIEDAGFGVENSLWGLLHDASEAYLVDLPRPLKRYGELGKLYKEAESNLMKVICEKFKLSQEEPDCVKYFDNSLLMGEARDLMKKPPIPWHDTDIPAYPRIILPVSHRTAEKMFLSRFEELYGK